MKQVEEERSRMNARYVYIPMVFLQNFVHIQCVIDIIALVQFVSRFMYKTRCAVVFIYLDFHVDTLACNKAPCLSSTQ